MKMIRRLSLLLAALITITSCFACFASAEDETGETPDNPGISSGNAVVAYCIDDDQFLYSNRIDEKVAPTVATKLVACMVVMDILKEQGRTAAETQVTVTENALANTGDIIDVRVPMMGLKAGNVYTARDLLSSTLVACANDAVASLACHFGEQYLGGDITDFVARMNKKVADLGLQNTNFTNPTGLDSPNQYTTPREVALIATAFYQYNELVSLSNVESFQFNGSSTVRNKNYLKSNYYVNGYLNKNAIGLIAGQLDKTGNYCLITASQKDGRTYIFVVMCASGMIVERIEDVSYYSFGYGNAYDDMNKLIGWTRDSFTLLNVATADKIVGELRVNLGSSADHVMVVPAQKVEKLVINSENGVLETKVVYDETLVYKKEFNGVEYDTIDAPVSHGQKVGTITFYYNGAELASVDAVAKEGVDSDSVKATLNSAKNFLFGGVMKTVLYVIGGIVLLYLLWASGSLIYRMVDKKKGTKKGKTKVAGSKKTKKKNNKKTAGQDLNAVTKEHR